MSMLPVSGEQHEKAREAAHGAIVRVLDDRLAFNIAAYGVAWTGEKADTEFFVGSVSRAALAAYFASLAAQGVRLVDVSEVVEWLREAKLPGRGFNVGNEMADAFLARFGGGDER